MKHPEVRSTRIEISAEPERVGLETRVFEPNMLKKFTSAFHRGEETLWRKEIGDFTNLFWLNLARWSGMLLDPKRFPVMTYNIHKEDMPAMIKLCKEDEAVKRAFLPWRMQLAFKFMPKNLSKPKDMKKLAQMWRVPKGERTGILEYLEDTSNTDEHYIRVYENSDCWDFENVGAHWLRISLQCLQVRVKGLSRGRDLRETGIVLKRSASASVTLIVNLKWCLEKSMS